MRVALLPRRRAFCHELGKPLLYFPRCELVPGGCDELRFHVAEEGAGTIGLGRESMSILICESQVGGIGGEGSCKLLGKRQLLRCQDRVLADLCNLSLAPPEVREVAVADSSELPLVGHVCVLEVMDRAVAACCEDGI